MLHPGLPTEHQAQIYMAKDTVSVIRGGTAILECIAYGTPAATIIWSRVGVFVHLRLQQNYPRSSYKKYVQYMYPISIIYINIYNKFVQ